VNDDLAKRVSTDLYVPELVDVQELGEATAALIDRVVTDAQRIGIVRDGKVVAVVIDHDDAKIFETLELRAEEGWLTRVKEQEPDDGMRYTADGEPIVGGET
jgi:PHD/YefM family antitoxin component YafN of YafNO toxin-antitoxin module